MTVAIHDLTISRVLNFIYYWKRIFFLEMNNLFSCVPRYNQLQRDTDMQRRFEEVFVHKTRNRN